MARNILLRMRLLAALALLPCVMGCMDTYRKMEAYVPGTGVQSAMTPEEARAVVVSFSSGTLSEGRSAEDLSYTRTSMGIRPFKIPVSRIEVAGRAGGDALVLTRKEDGKRYEVALSELDGRVFLATGIGTILPFIALKPGLNLGGFPNYKYGTEKIRLQVEQFADALVVLKRESRRKAERAALDAQAAAQAARAAEEAAAMAAVQRELREFEATARRYRDAAPKPALPEEARKYKVQAEAAIQDKDFPAAAGLFRQALKLAPWWPEGHFNLALILGETGDRGTAIQEMKRYLMLVPDAADAREAQDKIYAWER
jgi:tetratricopeptide (TPR) repeat protein